MFYDKNHWPYEGHLRLMDTQLGENRQVRVFFQLRWLKKIHCQAKS